MIKYTKIVSFDVGTERPTIEYCEQLEAEFDKLVRYVRALDDYDFRKVKDEKAARIELDKAYQALSDETRKAIEAENSKVCFYCKRTPREAKKGHKCSTCGIGGE